MSDLFLGSFPRVPIYKDGDVIVAAGNLQRKEVVDMDRAIYTYIGIIVVWCVKFLFVPVIVGVVIKMITHKMFQPQPERQRKKRFH